MSVEPGDALAHCKVLELVGRGGMGEVYVQPFLDGGSKHMVSRAGGRQPSWSPDGAKLFFRGETHVMEVSVAFAPEFQSTRPVSLFEDRFHRPRGGNHTSYDVSRDGRFLMLERRVPTDD